MMKKMARALEKWGYYLLALLCMGTILLSALWTNQQRAGEAPGAQVISDGSQRLSQVSPAPGPGLVRPAAGDVLREYCEAPLYFPESGVWRVHMAVDFLAEAGSAVCAMADGVVQESPDGVLIDHGGETYSAYFGLARIDARPGQSVKAGDAIGAAGADVLFEGGPGHVCVRLSRQGRAVNFLPEMIDKREK